MSTNNYPLSVSIYKGEERFLVVPLIKHIGGFSVESKWFACLPFSTDFDILGNSVGEAIKHIMSSESSTLTPIERKMNATWKNGSKYKNWLSFWKNNLMARVNFYVDGSYTIYSTKRTEDVKGGYYDCIKEISLLTNPTAYEIGKAIKDVFDAADEFYLNEKEEGGIKQIQLLNGIMLIVKTPKDSHFEDSGDGSAAEIYQCYSYIPKENAESSAQFFLGIAPELDCNLETTDIQNAWEDLYGKADYFDVRKGTHGIYSTRAELKNKEIHKISYFLQISNDLLLECGMDVHQPNKRKKLDEKLVQQFEEFALSCKI